MATVRGCARALAVALATGILLSSPAKTSSLIAEDSGRYAAVHTREGVLQFWKQGARKPEWSKSTVGSGRGIEGTTSRLAYFAFLSGGRILAIVRLGDVIVLSQTGEILLRAKPIDPASTRSPPDKFEVTAAGQPSNGKDLYLVGGKGAALLDLGDIDTAQQRKASTISLKRSTDWVHFEYLTYEGMLPSGAGIVPEPDLPGTVSICPSTYLIGTVAGAVYFAPRGGATDDVKRRQVGHGDPKQPRQEPVLSTGCLEQRLGYSVTLNAEMGQVILWNLQDNTVLDQVKSSDKNGHPGVALGATNGADGSEFMSIGDFDIRIWSTKGKKLALKAEHDFDDSEDPDLGAVAKGAGYLIFDGKRLWEIDKDGRSLRRYAGPEP
ncbi:hypothetical protein ABIA99_003732 [Bradyrhizobium sp. LB12.1]|uniref:hypothetical protein n=1 Tax=Bradyrhizobium sp. LB12.1 TaxID=3156327 RepID=UPI0033942FA3